MDKFEEGVILNVLLELETLGEELIWTQVLKLSEETWKVPEQLVSEVFVVTEVVSIVSEKVTEIVEVTTTDVSESDGEVDETVGAVVSVVVVVLSVVPVAEYSSLSSLQEMIVRLKQKISKMNNPFFIFSSIPKVKYYGLVY